METQALMLGDVNLERYVHRSSSLSKERRGEIDGLIAKLRENAMNVELLPLKLVQA